MYFVDSIIHFFFVIRSNYLEDSNIWGKNVFDLVPIFENFCPIGIPASV